MFELFRVPECASAQPSVEIPAGGFGVGHLLYRQDGSFEEVQVDSSRAPFPATHVLNQFFLWTTTRGKSAMTPLTGQYRTRARLFPCMWDRFDALDDHPDLELESMAFSPLLAQHPLESRLPLYSVVWRLRNAGTSPMECALMLTWIEGNPEQFSASRFDFQHDKLCLTGSLGDPTSPVRVGIAIPDLHSEGIYQQSIEPFTVAEGLESLREDFAADGELDPLIARGIPQGAAAWVKFTLNPDEIQEIPFFIAWHSPTYQQGSLTGKAPAYTRSMRKRRPDNAIVWIAEQGVENYGTETATFKHWIRQIADWQEGLLASSSKDVATRKFERLTTLLQAESYWAEDGSLHVQDPTDPTIVEEIRQFVLATEQPT